ncbi:uncharacterized protein LOC126378727 isoform X1 [Pectinophora gossypiella]|nr:uncharacterized protein LOC126376654 isoform X2 [Pectinophora gossypiella]XP_049883067.1 uncharacterized protein LOC126378727 isoform X1 [Pectinophora gossypiella]
MGSLPKDRVNPARVFEKVGLDYCGPFEVKQSTVRRSIVSKGYVLVIVCFTTKAVHLEVVSDMTTEAFLAALKRFIARRGLPSDIYSDNAKTFKGAHNKLNDLYKLANSSDFQNSVSNFTANKGIQFHFIPDYSPNHGGLWEAAVKSAKYHMKRIVGLKTYTYEQLSTIFTEIEAVLNSRPITPMSQDPSDFSCLTPGHFIIGCPLTSYPCPDLTEIPINRLKFWRSCEQARQHFWRAWSHDYLSSLHQRHKWQYEVNNIKENMVVLLKHPSTPPLQWPLGRISKVYIGDDNKVRTVQIVTADHKYHTRAVSKIVILPTEN